MRRHEYSIQDAAISDRCVSAADVFSEPWGPTRAVKMGVSRCDHSAVGREPAHTVNTFSDSDGVHDGITIGHALRSTS